MPPNRRVSKRKKFVKDGIFYAELNDFLAKELAEAGYAGCEVRVTPMKTEVIIRATKTQMVVGPKGRTIRELTALVQKRFQFKPKQLELYAEKVRNKGLSALAQAESVRFRLFEGLNVRRACYSVLRFIMDSEAKGCEVVVSGKLRGQRAKSMKFREGYMIHAGDATNYYIDEAVKHVHLRQGVLGIKVKIMLPHGEEKGGAAQELPDIIKIHEPKQLEHDSGGIPIMPDVYAAQADPYAANVPMYEQAPPQQQLPSDQQFDGYQQQDAGDAAAFQEDPQFQQGGAEFQPPASGGAGFDDYGNQQQFQQPFDQPTGGGYQDMPQY